MIENTRLRGAITVWLKRIGIGLIASALIGCDHSGQGAVLEPIRIKPQHALELPADIQFDDGGVHYLIEPYAPLGVDDYKRYGAHYLVHARIDRSDTFVWPGRKLNPGPHRNYSYFYAAVFPQMRQPTAKEMEEMSWFIPGYLRVHVQFAIKEAQDKGLVYTQIDPRYSECDEKHGYIFLNGTESRVFGLIPYCKTPPTHINQDIYYLSVVDDGEPAELIKCTVNEPNDGCKVRVLSHKYPVLEYEISFQAIQLKHWREIITAVRREVDSQIQGVYIIDDNKEK